MSHRILNVPPDCDELKEFIELFKFQSEKETYVRHTLLHIKQKWGVELTLGDGFHDSTMTVTKDGKLVFPYRHLASDKLDIYLKEKIGDLNLYSRLYESKARSYEINIAYNIGNMDNQYWGDLTISLDNDFNIINSTFTFDSNEAPTRRVEFWLARCSWLNK